MQSYLKKLLRIIFIYLQSYVNLYKIGNIEFCKIYLKLYNIAPEVKTTKRNVLFILQIVILIYLIIGPVYGIYNFNGNNKFSQKIHKHLLIYRG